MKQVSLDRLPENGMMFYGQYGGDSNVSGVFVKGGSIHDPTKKRGIAHLCEHVVCRSSSKYSGRQIDLMLEEFMGGPDGNDINIRIDRSSTFFGHGMLLYPNHMFKSLDMFVSMFLDRILDQEGLDVEKAAIHQEYFVYGKDVIYNEADDLMHQTMYDLNPARNRIDCEPEELRMVTLGQIRQFINRWYSPKNTGLIVLGPKFKKVRYLAKKYFSHLPEVQVPLLDPSLFKEVGRLKDIKSVIVERAGIGQNHLAIGFPTETYCTKDDAVLDILARIWAFRLRMRLREGNRDFEKGVYRALTFTPRTFAHGMIFCWLATKSEEFVCEAENSIIQECQKLRTELVPEDEFKAIKNSIRNYYVDAFMKTPENLSEMIIAAACNGDEELVHLHSFRERLDKVTRSKIREVANKYFCLPNYCKVLIKPRPA